MNSKPKEALVDIYSHVLERKLAEYLEAVGPYYTLDDLREWLSSGPRPIFTSKKDLADFNAKILSKVLSEKLRRALGSETTTVPVAARPPFNAEYLLHILLPSEEREFVIGDLIEEYSQVFERFGKRRADTWFYKQVAGSLLPLLRRTILRIGALVWLGRILRRLIS